MCLCGATFELRWRSTANTANESSVESRWATFIGAATPSCCCTHPATATARGPDSTNATNVVARMRVGRCSEPGQEALGATCAALFRSSHSARRGSEQPRRNRADTPPLVADIVMSPAWPSLLVSVDARQAWVKF